MTEERPLTRADIMPVERYTAERRQHKARIAAIKQNRRIEVGPYATFYFENFDTMWHQVHEMLYIERGGEAAPLAAGEPAAVQHHDGHPCARVVDAERVGRCGHRQRATRVLSVR